MTCRKAGELLSPYLDGELKPRPAAVLEAHLAGCAGCRAELSELRRAVNALATPPVPVQPEGLLTEFKMRLHSESARPPARVPAPLFPRLLVPAGGLAVVLLAGLLVARPWDRSSMGARGRAADPPRMVMAQSPSEPAAQEQRSRFAAPSRDEGIPAPEGATASRRTLGDGLQSTGSTPSPTSSPAKAESPVQLSKAPPSLMPERRADRAGAGGPPVSRAPRPAANRVPKDRRHILLPPGVVERDEAKARARKPKPSVTLARAPERPVAQTGDLPQPAAPAAAGVPGPAPRVAGAAGTALSEARSTPPAEAGRGVSHGWVAIRFTSRPAPTGQEAAGFHAEEALGALQRDALQRATADANSGQRQAKQSAPARRSRTTTVAPALFAAMRREVNVLVNDAPIAELAQKLSQGAGIGITLSPRVAADSMRATADLRGLPLHEALAKLAEAAGLTITPSGNAVLLLPRVEPGPAGRTTLWSSEWGLAPRNGFALPAAGEKSR